LRVSDGFSPFFPHQINSSGSIAQLMKDKNMAKFHRSFYCGKFIPRIKGQSFVLDELNGKELAN
jgi:hypothetical protein